MDPVEMICSIKQEPEFFIDDVQESEIKIKIENQENGDISSENTLISDVSSATFLKLGNVYTKSSLRASKPMALRRFKFFFGITPVVSSIVWQKIKHKAPVGAEPKHLLWCLSFLKLYSNEHCRRSLFKADEKTLRKWIWIFVELLSNLNEIVYDKRFDGAVNGQTCFCSLDGTDFKIVKPNRAKPLKDEWYSRKLRGPGVRYEIGLNIQTGDIVWAHGGYPCGQFPDLKIARESYILSVNPGERTMADKEYKDATYFILPNEQNSKQHKFIMSRHETVNRRLKLFQILNQPFRHSLEKHQMVFHAIANLTQLMIQNGDRLFSVNLINELFDAAIIKK